MIACAGLAAASTITFGLGGDPNQYYTFTPDGAPAGVTDTEPVGPYPGWLGENTAADSNLLFCITFLKTANWGGTYSAHGRRALNARNNFRPPTWQRSW